MAASAEYEWDMAQWSNEKQVRITLHCMRLYSVSRHDEVCNGYNTFVLCCKDYIVKYRKNVVFCLFHTHTRRYERPRAFVFTSSLRIFVSSRISSDLTLEKKRKKTKKNEQIFIHSYHLLPAGCVYKKIKRFACNDIRDATIYVCSAIHYI